MDTTQLPFCLPRPLQGWDPCPPLLFSRVGCCLESLCAHLPTFTPGGAPHFPTISLVLPPALDLGELGRGPSFSSKPSWCRAVGHPTAACPAAAEPWAPSSTFCPCPAQPCPQSRQQGLAQVPLLQSSWVPALPAAWGGGAGHLPELGAEWPRGTHAPPVAQGFHLVIFVCF